MKKVWEKPKLVVLYRGKSEETVLAACKSIDGSLGTGPNLTDLACVQVNPQGSCVGTTCAAQTTT